MKKLDSLQACRAAIDEIDNSILALLAKRVDIVRHVGELKHRNATGKSIMRPGREADMVRRIAASANGDVVYSAALAQIWRTIIACCINIEEKPVISTVSHESNRECYWLSREYFGAFTPMLEKATPAEVLQDLLERRATVAVVPLFGKDTSPRSWWSRLQAASSNGIKPRVFAKIPFLQMAPSAKVPLVAIGFVDPEPTGADDSLWVIQAEERIPLPVIEGMLAEAKLPFMHLDTCRVLEVATLHHYLFRLEGFVDENHPGIKAFNAIVQERYPAESSYLGAHYLGSYATPIMFEMQ